MARPDTTQLRRAVGEKRRQLEVVEIRRKITQAQKRYSPILHPVSSVTTEGEATLAELTGKASSELFRRAAPARATSAPRSRANTCAHRRPISAPTFLSATEWLRVEGVRESSIHAACSGSPPRKPAWMVEVSCVLNRTQNKTTPFFEPIQWHQHEFGLPAFPRCAPHCSAAGARPRGSMPHRAAVNAR